MKTYNPIPGKGFFWGVLLVLFTGGLMITPLIMMGINGNNKNPVFMVVMALMMLLVAGFMAYLTWGAKNLSYAMDEKNLIIRWAFNEKKIPFDHIKGAKIVIGNSSLKVAGASWPGFHWGSFTDPTGKGTVNLYATRLYGEMVLIKTKWETIGLTPEDIHVFLEDLHLNVPDLSTDNFEQIEQEKGSLYSPWKDKFFVAMVIISGFLFAGTVVYLMKTVPNLPAKVPMHFNISGQVDRYGSPSEVYMPLGIGILVDIMMIAMSMSVARNNRMSARMMGVVCVLIAVIFTLIPVSMTMMAR